MKDELVIFSGRVSRYLAEEICSYLEAPLGQAEIFKFSNDNTFVKVNQNIRGRDVFVIQTSCPPVDENLMELLIMLDALRRASAQRITAVLPYFPYARSDKKDQPRVPITARLVADMITAAGANRVVTVDLHADQIQGFFTIPLDHLTAEPILCDHFKNELTEDLVVVATDPGSAKRANKYSQRLGTPLAVMDKRRVGNEDRVEVVSLIGDVSGKRALIVEDEIDTAGTVCEATGMLLRHGAREVWASCTHPVFSGPAVKRLAGSRLKGVVVTNTIPVPPEKRSPNVTVLSIAPLLAEAIKRIHTGESISSLFI